MGVKGGGGRGSGGWSCWWWRISDLLVCSGKSGHTSSDVRSSSWGGTMVAFMSLLGDWCVTSTATSSHGNYPVSSDPIRRWGGGIQQRCFVGLMAQVDLKVLRRLLSFSADIVSFSSSQFGRNKMIKIKLEGGSRWKIPVSFFKWLSCLNVSAI